MRRRSRTFPRLTDEAQQKAIEEHPDHIFYNLNIDAGAMWARRLIDRMVAAEAATPTGLRAAE